MRVSSDQGSHAKLSDVLSNSELQSVEHRLRIRNTSGPRDYERNVTRWSFPPPFTHEQTEAHGVTYFT